MRVCSGEQHEATVAIGTFDEGLIAHFEIDLGMAERAVPAVAGRAGVIDLNSFRHFDRHGCFLLAGRNIAVRAYPASLGEEPPFLNFFWAVRRVSLGDGHT